MYKASFSGKSVNSTLMIHVCAIISVIIWGVSFIATKMLLINGLNAVEIYLYRFLIAYLLTLLICPKPLFCNSMRDELMFVLCGLCGGSIYFIAENIAVIHTLVSNVALITSTSPLMTTLLIGLLYKNQRPSRGMLIGSFVAIIGVGCVIFNSSFVVNIKPMGDLLALLAAFCWAIYSIILRPLSAVYSVWFVTRKTFFYGLITALPFTLMEPSMASLEILSRPVVIGNLAFLGFCASMLAYVLWSVAIKGLGSVKAGNYLYFQPIVTLICSALMINEAISTVGYIGCGLILGGLIIGEKLGRNNNRVSR